MEQREEEKATTETKQSDGAIAHGPQNRFGPIVASALAQLLLV
jgi:hypothetical protein